MRPQPLIDEAKKAEDVGNVFALFKEHVPERAAHCTLLISELFAIAGALRTVHEAVREFGRARYEMIEADLTLVRKSLFLSLVKILEIVGEIAAPGIELNSLAFKRSWNELHKVFAECGRTLLARLESYRTFLLILSSVVRGTSAGPDSLQRLRREIHSLDTLSTLPAGMQKLNLGRSNSKKDRQPKPAAAPPASGNGSATSPSDSIPPLSPTSSGSYRPRPRDSTFDHWATQVFQNASSTSFSKSSGSTKCYDPGKKSPPEWLDSFEFLFDLNFKGERPASVGLYVRQGDNRARILYMTHRQGKSPIYSSRVLTVLEFRRNDNMLQLVTCENGRLEVWATLKFKTIERLAIVQCTLVALRAYDTAVHVTKIRDFELAGEMEAFGGTIDDDGYLHSLRLYYDRSSNAARLMASAHTGELKNTPVWIAFIHFQLNSSSWLIPPSDEHPNRVLLRDLHRHIMAPEYSPELDRAGRHVFNFTVDGDAEDFVKSIQDLARLCRRRSR